VDRGRVGEDRGSKETDGCPLTEVCYKSSPLIAKINPVNLGDKDKPRLISCTYKPQNGHWMQVQSHSGPKLNAKRANGRTGKRVKRRLERC
jgi:hypothetical protein